MEIVEPEYEFFTEFKKAKDYITSELNYYSNLLEMKIWHGHAMYLSTLKVTCVFLYNWNLPSNAVLQTFANVKNYIESKLIWLSKKKKLEWEKKNETTASNFFMNATSHELFEQIFDEMYGDELLKYDDDYKDGLIYQLLNVSQYDGNFPEPGLE
jgi:hypothetical protein